MHNVQAEFEVHMPNCRIVVYEVKNFIKDLKGKKYK